MTKNFRINEHCQDEDLRQDGSISFPARFRVRCPRCGADRQAPKRTGESGRYVCQSTDQTQSNACVTRAKERRAENLVAETRSILRKFGFGPVSSLRVVN